MALLTADRINQFGVKEEYWRIVKINIDLTYNFCDITLGSYHSQEAREAEVEPMNLRKVRAKWSDEEFKTFFSAEALTENPKNIYEIAYEYIKSKDDIFSEAEDC